MPLQESITYANVAISLYNDEGQTFIYGYIPIVVAKCGLYLKDNATETEGIFRLSGSAKRIKDLQAVFDQPPKYGKGLDWAGFTVHDAANILRRYLNHLPDPIIPYDWYDSFREPLKGAWPIPKVIARMQELVASLPPLNRQLLLYILDLLAVFASKSEINRMTSENLSAIFQPGLITHPRDDMAPQEYKLSQEVLVFLIDNQSHFLLDSLCSPAKEQTPSNPAQQKKTSVSRRRTLQATRRSPQAANGSGPDGDRVQTPNSDVRSSPIPGTSRSGTLSRSNTVPTKRSLPGTVAADIHGTPRHVSSPLDGRGFKTWTQEAAHRSDPHIDHSGPTNKDQQRHSPGDIPSEVNSATSAVPYLAPPSEQLTRSSGSSRTDLEPVPESGQIRRLPVLRHDSRPGRDDSRRNSHHSSIMGADTDFCTQGSRKATGETPQNSTASPVGGTTGGSQRPIGVSGGPVNTEKSRTSKETRTTSSSPSKFSNLFKKKPRNQSVSSTSEAGGRRDLDK